MSKIGEYLNGIPARRWHIIALRTEFSEDQILDSPALTLAICANEKHRAETGRDDYPRFLDMGMGDLTEYLGADALPVPAEDGDGQEDVDPVGRFPGVAGGTGVAVAESPVLSADQDFAD